MGESVSSPALELGRKKTRGEEKILSCSEKRINEARQGNSENHLEGETPRLWRVRAYLVPSKGFRGKRFRVAQFKIRLKGKCLLDEICGGTAGKWEKSPAFFERILSIYSRESLKTKVTTSNLNTRFSV